jgi:purine nucleosidase
LADSAPKEITLVALGPLTNIALATKLDPELPGKFKRLIVMGGAYLAKGNSWTPAAEFNFYVDPEAAHIVLNEWPQITVAPWETAMAYPLSVSQVEQLGQIDAPQAEFFQRSVSKRFIEQIPGQPALYEPDAIAMAAAIEPDIVLQQETCYAQVELAGSATRGQLVVDWFHLLQKLPNVNIVTAIDRDRFWQLMQLACGAPVR